MSLGAGLRRALIVVAFVTLAASAGAAGRGDSLPVFDDRPEKSGGKLLRNFRTTGDLFREPAQPMPSRQGLEILRASGSGQFSLAGLRELRARVAAPAVTIVDLRQESHGLINDEPVSWYTPRDVGNLGRALSLIEAEERTRLNALFNAGQVKIHQILEKDDDDGVGRTKEVSVTVDRAAPEGDAVQELGMGYLRLPVTDHRAPTDAPVDRFVRFVRAMPDGTWLHFHCHAGRGRTTTFLAMYDMMRNAPQVSLQDILGRQWLLGGLDLRKMPPPGAWKREAAQERLAFLTRFHAYCKACGPRFETAWSQWKTPAHQELQGRP